MPGRDAVQLLVDRDAVHDVMFRYADGVDRRDMERVRACFAPDLKVVGWGGGFADRDAMITYISGVAIFHTTMHMFGNDYIDVDGDTAHIDCYAMLTHHLDGANGDTSEMNVSGGRYVESLTRRDGQWVITQRGGDPHWSSRGVIDVITDDPATQWLLDRAEIHDLMMEYALGIDLRDYDRVGRCFASSPSTSISWLFKRCRVAPFSASTASAESTIASWMKARSTNRCTRASSLRGAARRSGRRSCADGPRSAMRHRPSSRTRWST